MGVNSGRPDLDDIQEICEYIQLYIICDIRINNFAPDYLRSLINLREIRQRISKLEDNLFLLKTLPKSSFSRSEAAFSSCGPE